MSDGTILFFCELCRGSVDVDDVPDEWNGDTSPHVCEACLPVLALPLTEAQRSQVVEWMWENLAAPGPRACSTHAVADPIRHRD